MTEYDRIAQEIKDELWASLSERFNDEKVRKLTNFRQQNAYVLKGQTLFTGSSLMEHFPITEYCLNEGLPVAYNRGIGGYTTDNIGTNDIRLMPEGEDWFAHLSANYRKICEIIREKLPETVVYMMAYYPVNPNKPLAKDNSAMQVRTNENIARANRMVEALAEEFGFHYIDVNDGLKDPEGNLWAEHTPDGIHFDAALYRTVFDRVRKYL